MIVQAWESSLIARGVRTLDRGLDRLGIAWNARAEAIVRDSRTVRAVSSVLGGCFAQRIDWSATLRESLFGPLAGPCGRLAKSSQTSGAAAAAGDLVKPGILGSWLVIAVVVSTAVRAGVGPSLSIGEAAMHSYLVALGLVFMRLAVPVHQMIAESLVGRAVNWLARREDAPGG